MRGATVLRSTGVTEGRNVIDEATATAIVRSALRSDLTVRRVRALTGGMVSSVCALDTDGEPATIVAKVAPEPNAGLEQEKRTLDWFAEHTDLPVPAAYACPTHTAAFAGTCLLMQAITGRHLGEAHLTATGMADLQRQMADHLIALHGHRRQAYGSALDGAPVLRWVDWFAPKLRHNVERASDHISGEARRTANRVLEGLDAFLPEHGEPTLVHGDVWATNVMVDDRDPDRPRLTAFLDCAPALFTDVEYELAYLLVFATADRTFFERYAAARPLRDGFERRCLVYWFNTLLLHVWLFGDDYRPRCEHIARQIDRAV